MNTKTHLFFLILLIVPCFVATAAAYPLTADNNEVGSALAYLASCQQADGGFAEDGKESTPSLSTWAILAIVASGGDPDQWSSGGASASDYLHTLAEETLAIDGTSETAKLILTVVAAGDDPRNFEGHDFVAFLQKKQREDGRYGEHIYTTNWAIMALSAAGEDTSKGVAWLKTQQNEDGGFGWAVGAESDCDDTASAIEALIAGDTPQNDPVIRDAIAFLKAQQQADGGFNYGGSSATNSASDSWVIQALVAAGEDPLTWTTATGNTPVSHLLSFQTEEGYFKWTSVLADVPCKMTATAIPALTGRSYPIIPDQNAVPVPQPTPLSTPVVTATQATASATTAVPDADGRTVTDDFGKEVYIPAPPQRIVSLAPANTEILYALGLGDKVVGVTDYCNYPEEALAAEKVGGYSSVNIEKVLQAKPDLVVAAFGNTAEVIEHLDNLGLTVISLNPASIGDVQDNIRLVGEATWADDEAAVVVSEMQACIDAVETAVASADTTPSVVHMVWNDPIWVSGTGSFQDEMFEMAGGTNAFPTVQGWEIVSMEEFIVTDPDVIIANSGAGMGGEQYDILYRYVLDEPRFQGLSAVKEGRVYLVDSDIIDRGGPRIVEALEIVAHDIHPECFPEESQTQPVATQSPAPFIGAVAAFAAAGYCLRRQGE
ncbi:helical backbone metal receptor [Methanogenium organophilum]|uniref:Helical backbone metal receptor n=1 Tax=Methanogenium organophilum TaxID=2199 RepID=A0A9X9S7X2_METOG|nr:helical backbone metal receptor [Methanogenium organophilum]WAI02420.1 helical backbone metal receptor [Methanogenium organophilum]